MPYDSLQVPTRQLISEEIHSPTAVCWLWCICIKLLSYDGTAEMTEISSHTENITDATSAGIEGAKGNKLNMIDIKNEVSVFKL